MPLFRKFKEPILQSLFTNTPLPGYSGNDGIIYSLGTCFKSSVKAQIVGYSFYKGFNNQDISHVMEMWDMASQEVINNSKNTLISEVGFVGWVKKNLAKPISIIPDKEYSIVLKNSYFYVADTGISTKGSLIFIASVDATPPLTFPVKQAKSVSFYIDVICRT